MFTRWGLALLGAVLGFLLGAGAAQSEGEASYLVAAVVPWSVPGKPHSPVLLLVLLATLAVAALGFWLKQKDRASREREARKMPGGLRVLEAIWPILPPALTVIALAHCRQVSFGSMVSDLGFYLV